MSEFQAYEKPGPVEEELRTAISSTEEIIATLKEAESKIFGIESARRDIHAASNGALSR